MSDGRKGSLMRFSRSGSACCVVMLLAGASPAFGQNIVENGGFETGAFFPWIAPGPIANEQLFFVSGGGGHTGQRYAQLSSTQLRFVTQFLATTAGLEYELSFWLRKPLNFPSPFYIRWEGSFVYSQSLVLPDNSNWHRLSFPLHSNFSGSLLEFGQMDFPGVYHLDDVSVVPAPAPSAAALLLVGGAAAAMRRRR